MGANEFLARFTIPTPCPMDWERMSGDDRRRRCEVCGKHVHNLTAMTSDEIVHVLSPLSEGGGEVCGQAFRRPDGTLVVSASLPAAHPLKGWQFRIRSLMAMIAAIAPACGLSRWFATQPVRTAGQLERLAVGWRISGGWTEAEGQRPGRPNRWPRGLRRPRGRARNPRSEPESARKPAVPGRFRMPAQSLQIHHIAQNGDRTAAAT